MSESKQYKKGHFISIALTIGIPVGIPVGLALGNIALGPMLGVLIGLGIGVVLEKIYNRNPIELTEREKSKNKKLSMIAFISGLILFVGVLSVYLALK